MGGAEIGAEDRVVRIGGCWETEVLGDRGAGREQRVLELGVLRTGC